MQLEEHKAYNFKLLKKTKTDECEFYVLKDPFGTKHLMPTQYYTDYNFKIGDTIKCWLDKINCKGQKFLEPEHPHYKRGNKYKFSFTAKRKEITKKEEEIEILSINDKYKSECVIMPDNKFHLSDDFKNKTFFCEVKRVKKSRLYLIYIKT